MSEIAEAMYNLACVEPIERGDATVGHRIMWGRGGCHQAYIPVRAHFWNPVGELDIVQRLRNYLKTSTE